VAKNQYGLGPDALWAETMIKITKKIHVGVESYLENLLQGATKGG
jgi:hypothetical protein